VIAAPEPSMGGPAAGRAERRRLGKSLRKVEVRALWRFLLDDVVAIP
jgi:hypothetical protein